MNASLKRNVIVFILLAILTNACSATNRSRTVPDAVEDSGPMSSAKPSSTKGSKKSTEPGAAAASSGARASTATGANPGGATAAGMTPRGKKIVMGPGITQKEIHIGFQASDPGANKYFEALGAGSVNLGDNPSSIRAVTNYINKTGGIVGRKLIPHMAINSASDNEDEYSQRQCSMWTEETRVFAAITMGVRGSKGIVEQCLHNKNIPILFDAHGEVGDDHDFKRWWSTYFAPNMFSRSRYVSPFIDGLKAQGYFTKGAKIGIIRLDRPNMARESKLVRERLAKYGLKVVAEYAGKDYTDMSPGVLAMRRPGVDRVIVLDNRSQVSFFFMTAAESQAYRPKYGLSSFGSWTFLTSDAPAAQLRGAKAVGWRPTADIFDVKHNAKASQCLKIFKDAGITWDSESAYSLNYAYCDLLLTLRAALERAPAYTTAGLQKAMEGFGESLESALTIGTRIDSRHHDGAKIYRYGAYFDECSCFKYTSGPKAAS